MVPFGVILVGHISKWPIYITILVWWAFVIYTTIRINHQKDASTSGNQGPSRYPVATVDLHIGFDHYQGSPNHSAHLQENIGNLMVNLDQFLTCEQFDNGSVISQSQPEFSATVWSHAN
jgi:hypothetical protein